MHPPLSPEPESSVNHDPYAAPAAPIAVAVAVASTSAVDIDTLQVSERWKRYFAGIQRWGGLQLPAFKALPRSVEKRRAAMKDIQPPAASMVLAFVFGFFYYLAKGMWKKGLVLLAILIPSILVLSIVLYMIGGEAIASMVNFLGSAVFCYMAPRDYYAFMVDGDRGWLPSRPF